MIRHFLICIIITAPLYVRGSGDSWTKIIKEKRGVAEFYWYPNNVIIENSRDIIDGIEHDLSVAFIDYLNKKYEVDVEMRWIETKSFEEVMGTVRNGSGGTFGASSISITPQRKEYLNFTQPYMADVAVLISNANLPIALTEEELKAILIDATAISITNTTLVESLQKLGEKLGLEFDIEFVKNSGNIINQISEQRNSFGYVDIANFLVAIDKNTNVRRQFFYPVKLEGLAIIYSKKSDWTDPVNGYFNSQQFEVDKLRIITKYLGSNASEIIERISKSAEIGPLEEIVLSNREKESQYERLIEAAKKDQDSERLTIILISIILVVIVILLLLYTLYRIKAKNTEQLLSQQRLIEDTNNRLRALNEEKNNLIQILAHDLRSPLSNILGGAQIIESNETLSSDGNKLLGFILQSSDKMRSMIDKILDVDAIETGKHNLKIEPLKVVKIVEQVAKDNAARASKKSIQIATDLSADVKANGDKVYLSQVLDNLISNAIKYSKEHSVVTISISSDEEMVMISVADQGPGLTEEDKERLFEKYQHLSAKPTKGETSIGLGLSIVKVFTERMGGEVDYDTELGKGTTFRIKLKKG